MAYNTQSPKRRRTPTDEDGHSAPSTITPVSLERGQTWFEDGNIILISGTDGTSFKVYRGILSQHSEVFRDMFMLPQPDDAEKFEGVPVVHLSDSPKDLNCILSILFDIKIMTFMPDVTLSFVTVSAMLRLGSKYEIKVVQQEAIRRLQQCFPENLGDFRTNDSVAPIVPGSYFHCHAISLHESDAIAVISLARTYDLTRLLGPTFYTCAQLPNAILVNGVLDEDGNHWKLSPDDLLNCLNGQQALRNALFQSIVSTKPLEPLHNCQTKQTCRLALALSSQRLWNLDARALLTSRVYDELYLKSLNCCRACSNSKAFRFTCDLERNKIWERLGDYFGFAQGSAVAGQ